MKIADITQFLGNFAPLFFQEDYDNSGLLLGTAEEDCRGALICLDTTEAIVREAVNKGCNLVISHHPLIFHGLKQINGDTGTGRAVIAAIKKEVAVYAIHTNLDNVLPGVNTTIAGKLGLVNQRFLLPKMDSIKEGQRNAGSGLAGELAEPLGEKQFLHLLQQQFRIPVIRHSPLTGKTVRKVAVCGGAGSFLITNALSSGADFFITSDIKYHEFFGAEEQLVIADIGHYESEQFAIDLLYDAILEKFPNFAVLKAGSATNPVHYYL
jgi:dinuclear metal center YbgI/SA1388 family protein